MGDDKKRKSWTDKAIKPSEQNPYLADMDSYRAAEDAEQKRLEDAYEAWKTANPNASQEEDAKEANKVLDGMNAWRDANPWDTRLYVRDEDRGSYDHDEATINGWRERYKDVPASQEDWFYKDSPWERGKPIDRTYWNARRRAEREKEIGEGYDEYNYDNHRWEDQNNEDGIVGYHSPSYYDNLDTNSNIADESNDSTEQPTDIKTENVKTSATMGDDKKKKKSIWAGLDGDDATTTTTTTVENNDGGVGDKSPSFTPTVTKHDVEDEVTPQTGDNTGEQASTTTTTEPQKRAFMPDYITTDGYDALSDEDKQKYVKAGRVYVKNRDTYMGERMDYADKDEAAYQTYGQELLNRQRPENKYDDKYETSNKEYLDAITKVLGAQPLLDDKEELEKRERAAHSSAGIGSFGNAVSAIANLWGTANGAESQKLDTSAPKAYEAVKDLREEQRKLAEMYLNGAAKRYTVHRQRMLDEEDRINKESSFKAAMAKNLASSGDRRVQAHNRAESDYQRLFNGALKIGDQEIREMNAQTNAGRLKLGYDRLEDDKKHRRTTEAQGQQRIDDANKRFNEQADVRESTKERNQAQADYYRRRY